MIQKKHKIETEIKAITFHNMNIEVIDEKWQTDVIFNI